MFWVVQDNMYSEKAYESLLEQLKRQSVPYAIVKVVPFSNMLEIQGGAPSLYIPKNEPIYVCGSTSMGRIAKSRGWIPGYFDENLDYRKLLLNYGSDMLNCDAVVVPLRSVKWLVSHLEELLFARPVSDDKTFAGQCFTKTELVEWAERIIALDADNTYTTLKAEDEIVIAAMKEIYAEYRFYVVDGEVVTGSRYKQGDRVFYSANIDSDILEYARKIVGIWQPNRAFALDIAVSITGPKVLEINAINSAGFYACDMGKYVAAINNMRF